MGGLGVADEEPVQKGKGKFAKGHAGVTLTTEQRITIACTLCFFCPKIK
jgi:hypothetical protein